MNDTTHTPISNAERRRESEAAILAAAEEVFAHRGFKGATIGDIAERAGLPKANVLYYFPSKLALYRRVIADVIDAWLAAAEPFDDAGEGPREALTRYIHAKMELSRQRPNGSKVWANEIMHGAPIIGEYLATTLRAWVEARERRIREWIARGQMRAVEPRFLLYLVWAATQHYADFATQIEAVNGGAPLSEADYALARDTVTSILLEGVLGG